LSARPGQLLPFARGELLRNIERAEERIWLASPFLSVPVAEYIAEMARRSGSNDRRLLTALVPASVRARALDPKALRILDEAGFKLGALDNLHAKVSLVDDWGLVGSGNLTIAGLGSTNRGNVELGVVLDRDQVAEASPLFASWWATARQVGEEEIEELEALEPIGAPYFLKGAGPPLEPAQVGELELILAEDDATASARGYWLKSAYHDPDRPDWWNRGWISDAEPQPKYQRGDLIVIYLGAENGGPKLCPAVVRAKGTAKHDRGWVIEHRDVEAADQWPFVTKTEFVADLVPWRGVSLELIDKDGHSLQRGNCGITRQQFEVLAGAMLERAEPAASRSG
jgi:hypothetical protein